MAYASWSVVFGEQPSAAKWNILGSNDASFNDGTGIASMSHAVTTVTNPYKFSALHNASQNSGNAAFAQVSFNTELFDSNGNFASSTYTAPVNGFYLFGARIHTTSSPTRLIIALYKSGTEIARGTDVSDDEAQAAGTGVMVTKLLQLSAADTIDVRSFGNTTLTLAASNANGDLCYFWGVLISKL